MGAARKFLLIAVIGFLFTTNLTLSQTPVVWSGKYHADSSGWNLNLSEATLVPRYLHFFAAAVAVGGLLLMLLAWLKRASDVEYRRYIFRIGGRAFEYATMAQFAVGFWFLATLPEAQRALFMGGTGTATLLLITGIVAAVAALVVVGTKDGRRWGPHGQHGSIHAGARDGPQVVPAVAQGETQ